MNKSIYEFKILIVDNDIITIDNIKSFLINQGFNIIAIAHSAEEALIKAKKQKPDLVITDIWLDNEKSGYDLSNEIKKISFCKTLFTSSYSKLEIITKIIMEDPNALILKPVNINELRDKIYLKLNGNDKWEKIYQAL